jgi:plastin-1
VNQLAPSQCDKAALSESDLTKRAEHVLRNADKLDCRKFVTPRDIVKGNPKLNLAFVAHLFNTHPGLAPLTDEEKAALEEWLFASEGTREARAFSLWINSLGIEPFVQNLFEDLRDGLVLLRVFDKISPGSVDWTKVNQKEPLNKFKRVENANYATQVGKNLKFSLVGIAGSDLVDGNKTLTLALVWQMMRFHIVSVLKGISKSTGKDITDQDIVDWANHTVSGAGKTSTMSSFKDPSIRNGHFIVDLLAAIRPSIIDYSLVTPGESDTDATQNAKYAISIARKLGATIFCLPEDIVEVKPKMIMTFIGSVMAVALGATH